MKKLETEGLKPRKNVDHKIQQHGIGNHTTAFSSTISKLEDGLKKNPCLNDFQEYVKEMEIERGFNNQTVTEKCLLLGEEIGELFKAIRKAIKLKTDYNSDIGTVSEEIADIMIYLCSIANRFDIDIEQAFRDKEEINKKRIWQ